MSERTTMIERWFRRNAEMKQEAWRRIRGVHDGHGLYYSGSAIEYTGGEGTAATVIRDRTGSLPPLVRMGLPNQVTIRRFRDIYNTVIANEGTVLVAPRNVISAADIHLPTVEMIAVERKPRRFRPPHQVLKARVRTWKGFREAYFMSGYDLNERGLSYFFCELPSGVVPTSVEDAYRALQPESVKIALAQKRRVRRQGDMFFIETDRGDGPAYTVGKNRLFRTNHYAEEFGRDADDVVRFVRGDITHEPAGRRPDHKTLRLPGSRWWIAVQNTVPVTRNY